MLNAVFVKERVVVATFNPFRTVFAVRSWKRTTRFKYKLDGLIFALRARVVEKAAVKKAVEEELFAAKVFCRY